MFGPSRIGGDGPGGTFHLHCGDVEGEWTLAVGASGLVVERGHAKGDAACGAQPRPCCWRCGVGSARVNRASRCSATPPSLTPGS